METTRRLPVRRTVGAAFATIAKAPLRLLGLATVPLLGLVIWFWAMFEIAEPLSKGAVYLLFVLLAGYLLQYALFVLVLGALVRAAVHIDRNEPLGLASCLAASLRRLPRLMVSSWFLFVMGTGVIYSLFSMPPHLEYALPAVLVGLLAGFVWALSIPVCLMERRGPIASLVRAFALARGSRWRLVAALLIASVPILGLTIVLVSVTGAYQIGAFFLAFGFIVVSAVLSALVAVAYGRLAPPEHALATNVFD